MDNMFDPPDPKMLDKMKDLNTEAMRYAAMMKAARDAHNNGDMATAKMYSFTVSVMLGMKSKDELQHLAASALSLLSGMAEMMTDNMSESMVADIEKMLREGHS